jgi:YaiO family outer membrane protein
MTRFHTANIGILLAFAVATPAAAQSDDQTSVIQATAETRDYSDDLGSLRTVRIEYELDNEDLTLVISPALGQRRGPGTEVTAAGLGGTLYLKLVDGVTTRTQIFLAEEKPVFVNRDIAQDVSFNLKEKTVATLGGRWATHFDNQELVYFNAGLRQYFKGGAIAYRYSHINPSNGEAFGSHLVNLTVNDPRGRGKTQVWLAYGQTNPDHFDPALSFSGDDYGVTVRRIQPIGGGFSLIGTGGYASYDRPLGRVLATTFGLGFRLDVN